MEIKVATLVQQRTWKSVVPRTPDLNVLKGTWVFKLKRLPDGIPSRFKTLFCACGDLQREGVDFFDTYAPVVATKVNDSIAPLHCTHSRTIIRIYS
jgi:hypothetical protein